MGTPLTRPDTAPRARRPAAAALRLALAFAALTAALTAPSGAAASLVFHEEVSLADVLRPAAVVVLMELDDPPQVPVAIPVPGRPDKTCGSYAYGAWRGRVVRTVGAAAVPAPPAPGQRLTVFPADTPELVRISQQACLEGLGESPIFARYPGETPRPGGRYLVPLRWEAPYGWLETVAGAWLPPAAEPRVAAAREADALPPATADRAAEALADLLCVTDDDCTLGVTDCGPCGTCPDTPRRALPVETLRRFTAICAAERAKAAAPPPRGPRPPPPACEPCRSPPAPPPTPPRAVCRAMRCALQP